jgi:hypothetical protein
MTFVFFILNVLITLGVCFRIRDYATPVVGGHLPKDDTHNIAESACDTILIHTMHLVLVVIVTGSLA